MLSYIATCGNGIIDKGEECDHGTGNNGRLNDTCTLLCKNAVGSCGDGTTQSALGEQCDDANQIDTDDCTNSCVWSKLNECGDGVIQPDYEQCDAGAKNGNYIGTPCHFNCVLPYCGDNLQDINEECDDGNNLDNDGCTAVCTRENPAAPIFASNLVNPYNQSRTPLTNPEQPTYANIPTPARTPTGPGFAIFLASGAAAGIGLARRRWRG